MKLHARAFRWASPLSWPGRLRGMFNQQIHGSKRSLRSIEDFTEFEQRAAYFDGDPVNSSEETKARKPLAAAEVIVEEVEGNPGYYSSKFFLRPHYQLEGLTVSLRLVSKLPSAKGGK